MKNIANPLLAPRNLLLLAALFFSCNSTEVQTEGAELGAAESPAQPGQVILTQQQFEASAMELGKLQQNSFGSSIKINGVVDVPPQGRAEISSYYGGYVRNLNLLEGQRVKRGELLFALENPEYVQMQQDFLEAKSQLAYLKSDFERQQTLNEENIASRKNFLRAESEYNTTLAKVEGLKQRLSLINIQAEGITPENLSARIGIHAPISGFITEVNAINGAFLSPADVALSVINTENIHLELNVFERNIPMLKEGQPIRFRLPDGQGSYEAEVFMIGKAIETTNRMVRVHARMTNGAENELFTPGMYVEAEIYSSRSESPSLPSEAVVEGSEGYFVLVKKEEASDKMTFEQKQVKTGATSNGYVEILNAEEFSESDEFLVKGAFNLIVP